MPQPLRSVHLVTAFVAGVLLTGAVVTAQFGGGGGGNQERPVVAAFDADKDGRLNTVARQALGESARRGGGRGRGGGSRPPASPGVTLTPADVTPYAGAPIYDPATL